MPYPSPSDYQDALQFPEAAFADPLLARGTPAPGPLGLPRLITGAFAAVFPVDTREGRKAVRCFLSDVPGRAARAQAVAQHLAGAGLPETVPFQYRPRGVRVGTEAYPLVVMDWVEGEGLGRYVARHLHDPDALGRLAEAWQDLARRMEAARFAHGDIQPGNVLVRPHAPGEGPALALVDYDAAVVPALVGGPAPEAGHRHFQHPDRADAPAALTADRFPALVVYTALQALRAAPALWDRYDTGENLLFTADDFYDPERSTLFADLRALEAVRPLAQALAAACYLAPEGAPPLEAARRGAVRAVRARTRAPRASREGTVLREGVARWALPALALALAAALGLAVLVDPRAGLGLGLALLGALAAWGVRDYRGLEVVRRRVRLARERERVERLAAQLEGRLGALAAEREALAGGGAEARAERLAALRAEALGGHLRRHFVGELDSVPGVGHRAVVRLKAAGVRDAADASDARLAAIRDITDESRVRVAAWRDSLHARYASLAPSALSAAEERRLRRERERRAEALGREAARLRERVRVQREEGAFLHARQRALAPLGPAGYALFALRLRPAPAPPPPAPAQREASREAAPQAEPAQGLWWEEVA